MPRRWDANEEAQYRKQLEALYVRKNMSIRQVGARLGISEKTVFQRLKRLDIATERSKKSGYNAARHDFQIPSTPSPALAELIGILLGDGHISRYQVFVTLHGHERQYAEYISARIQSVFKLKPKILPRKRNGHLDVYFGSTKIVQWLRTAHGLVSHKVKEQVGVPEWILQSSIYAEAFLRGFFDTDGSIYKLRFGRQISFTNKSVPLLHALQRALKTLGYAPSSVSGSHVYLTRQADIQRFFAEVRPANKKHWERYRSVGTQVVNEGRL